MTRGRLKFRKNPEYGMKKMKVAIILTLIIISAAVLFLYHYFHAAADIVFINGFVYTVNENRSIAEAVVVRKNKIIFVGSSENARPFITEKSIVIDLQGRMLLPGFHDSHAHVLEGGVSLNMCNLSAMKTPREYVAALKDYGEKNPSKEWVTGFGWSLEAFPGGNPHKILLDDILPDRPAAVMCGDGHSIWVNSAALREAGVTAKTPDPAGGRIERDTAGEPTGTLREGAMELVRKKAFEPSIFEAFEGLEKGIALLNSYGITSFIEARAITADSYDLLYRLVHATGNLRARVTLSLYLDPRRDDAQIGELIGKYDDDRESLLKADQVKIFLDGVTESKTAWLSDSYTGEPENFGIPIFDMDRLKKYAVRLEKAGFQLHMHAIGDRAVHEGLDLVEYIHRAGGNREGRHHLVHLYLVGKDDRSRFKRLHVTGNIQAQWACPAGFNEINRKYLGGERFAALFPFRTLRDEGALLAGGSDWPVDIVNPLEIMQTAVTRQVPGQGGNSPILGGGERLDLADMIEAYTINGAWLQRREGLTGSIETGKLADLIVIDKNLFNVKPHELASAKILLTLLGGEPVYADSWAHGFFRMDR